MKNPGHFSVQINKQGVFVPPMDKLWPAPQLSPPARPKKSAEIMQFLTGKHRISMKMADLVNPKCHIAGWATPVLI
jgi:hypothetical protein